MILFTMRPSNQTNTKNETFIFRIFSGIKRTWEVFHICVPVKLTVKVKKLTDLLPLCIKTWFLCKTNIFMIRTRPGKFIQSWKLWASFERNWHNYSSVSVHKNRVSFSTACLSAWGLAVTKLTLQEDSGAQSVTPARFSSKEKTTPRSSTATKSSRTNSSLQTAGRCRTCWNHDPWAWHNNLLFLQYNEATSAGFDPFWSGTNSCFTPKLLCQTFFIKHDRKHSLIWGEKLWSGQDEGGSQVMQHKQNVD